MKPGVETHPVTIETAPSSAEPAGIHGFARPGAQGDEICETSRHKKERHDDQIGTMVIMRARNKTFGLGSSLHRPSADHSFALAISPPAPHSTTISRPSRSGATSQSAGQGGEGAQLLTDRAPATAVASRRWGRGISPRRQQRLDLAEGAALHRDAQSHSQRQRRSGMLLASGWRR